MNPGLPGHAGSIAEDERFMGAALDEARAALEGGDVPVGAVVVWEGRVIARGYNQREQLQDPTAHAEMVALTAAADFLGQWRLDGCTLYVTLEPCIMCAGALVLARLPRLVYGAADAKAGGCTSVYAITSDQRLNHQVAVEGGVMEGVCAAILQSFFHDRRTAGRK